MVKVGRRRGVAGCTETGSNGAKAARLAVELATANGGLRRRKKMEEKQGEEMERVGSWRGWRGVLASRPDQLVDTRRRAAAKWRARPGAVGHVERLKLLNRC
jgi:hypothetical protein